MQTYLIDDAASLSDGAVAEIHRRLEAEGWIVIQTPPGRGLEEALLALQAILGGVVYHPYSKEEGVVVIDNAYRPPRGMLPHTDGTYYPQPPALMCLQCVTAATTRCNDYLVIDTLKNRREDFRLSEPAKRRRRPL